MNLKDMVHGPWAIQPEMYAEIKGIYARHMRGDKIDLDNLRAQTGNAFDNKARPFEIIDGVAVIGLDGAISKKMNLMTQVSGGASTQLIESQIQQALGDSSVKAILLDIDSPGGTVDGTFELANFIRSAREQKPIEAFTDGTIASAAYLIASATDRITLASPGKSNQIGSIGVIMTHEFKPDKDGAISTRILSGKLKGLGAQGVELTEDGKELLQAKVDQLYTAFATDVAEFRSISLDRIDALQGGVLLGQEAIKAGLVDGVSTFQATIDRLAGGVLADNNSSTILSADIADNSNNLMQDKTMDINQLKADHPDLFNTVLAQGEQVGIEKGATQERERIKSVQEMCAKVPGHEALSEKLSFDGKSTKAEAAVEMVAADGAKMAGVRAQQAADAVAPVDAVEATTTDTESYASNEEKWKAEYAKGDEKLKADFSTEAHYMAYQKKLSLGQIRVQGNQGGN